ncbi:Glu/Leu/Phe/Val dehydrogenase dimerization domain-containing protein [Streptomyces sp. NPDC005483]|uniref:Glu/Leu/Phe/Val dehydrogenase family protein n=1 Tax=Streptomyces sp. NPDC005483 TaxID=3154882 RepID=UPI00339EB60C
MSAHTELDATIDHEEVVIRRGERTGQPVIVAIHNTKLGPALGGVRLTRYDSPVSAVVDVLRLSRAMTFKAAASNNGTGGGKSVVPLLPGGPPRVDGQFRTSLLLDVADVVHSLGGRYIVAPDVGTGPTEMRTMRMRTPYVGGYTITAEGIPATTHGTAGGVERALLATAQHLWGTTNLDGRTIAVIGFGAVGRSLTEKLIKRGATVSTTDIDESLREQAEAVGATWIPLDTAHEAEVDILAPCALGGTLTPTLVPRLRCKAFVGSANNQLSTDSVAGSLRERNIIWTPDFIANAGGILYASGIELQHLTPEQADHRLDEIAETTTRALERSDRDGVTTLAAAYDLARERLAAAETIRP